MEENEKFATYKEFGKMLREVADLFAKYGDTPLYDSAPDLRGQSRRIRCVHRPMDERFCRTSIRRDSSQEMGEGSRGKKG